MEDVCGKTNALLDGGGGGRRTSRWPVMSDATSSGALGWNAASNGCADTDAAHASPLSILPWM
jgi:hypothetical protein